MAVFDPARAGGMMGHLAALGRFDPQALKEALAYGVVTASFTVEDFSLDRLANIKDRTVNGTFASDSLVTGGR